MCIRDSAYPATYLQVNTDNGYGQFGPQNDGWCHIQTDRAKFSDGFFDLKNKSYDASDTAVKIKKNSFDNSKNDPRIAGVSSKSYNNVTSIKKAIFTSCEINKDKFKLNLFHERLFQKYIFIFCFL